VAPLQHVYLVVRRKDRWWWSRGGPYKINKTRENEAEIFRESDCDRNLHGAGVFGRGKAGICAAAAGYISREDTGQASAAGTDLREWFAQVYDAKGCTKEHFESWNTLAELALIKAMDLTTCA
jgi:hypothetical protein